MKKLTREEIHEFVYFVRSPFFNRNQSVVKLYEYLRKQYPEFEGEKVEKRYVYKKVFETSNYNDGFMRVLISNLTKLLKEYLTQIHLKSEPRTQKNFLLHELNIRKLEKEFIAVRKEAEKILTAAQPNTMHYFYDRAMLEDNIYFFNNWSRDIKKKNIELDEKSLKLIIDNFTKFYLIASITMYRKVLYVKNYKKINIDLRFIEEVLKILELSLDDFSDTPIITLYTNEVLLLTKGGRKYFDTLKDILLNHTQQLPYSEIYSLHNILQRYSTTQILDGHFNYEKEKFILYKSAVSGNNIMYPYKEYIEGYLFISAVNSAIRVKEISWAESFVKEHQHLLLPEIRGSVADICLSKIDFELGNYESSLSRLQNIKTKNAETLILIKIVLLKIYFELSLYNEADLAVDSLRHLIPKAEKTLAPPISESYKNFLKYYQMLIKAKEKNKKERSAGILKELTKNTVIEEYRWLMQKAEDF